MSRASAHHEAAAAAWERRGDAGWVEFERRCATVGRELAALEGDRASLWQLHARSLRPTGEHLADQPRNRQTVATSRAAGNTERRAAMLEIN